MADKFKEFLASISGTIEGLPDTFEADALSAYSADMSEPLQVAESLAIKNGELQEKNHKLIMSFGMTPVDTTKYVTLQTKEETPSYDGFFKK